jgi:hypothetical protein
MILQDLLASSIVRSVLSLIVHLFIRPGEPPEIMNINFWNKYLTNIGHFQIDVVLLPCDRPFQVAFQFCFVIFIRKMQKPRALNRTRLLHFLFLIF